LLLLSSSAHYYLTEIISWPLNPEHGFLFAQTMLGQSQFLAVQEYARLTQPWCDNDAASRSFILGQSYLHSKWVHSSFIFTAHSCLELIGIRSPLIFTDHSYSSFIHIQSSFIFSPHSHSELIYIHSWFIFRFYWYSYLIHIHCSFIFRAHSYSELIFCLQLIHIHHRILLLVRAFVWSELYVM